jgi:dsDNA-specific endonuclease/ATPase MutS2
MNFKIGDKVRFLNEKGEGIVSKLINKTTVGVTVEDGFEIPYQTSGLLLLQNEISTEMDVNNENTAAISTEIKSNKNFKKQEQEGIYVAFSPEKINDILHSDINVWFINNTEYKLLFTYSLFQNGNFITLETGNAAAFESLLIETIDRKELSDFSNFKIEVLFFNEKEHQHQAPVSEIIKLKPIKLYKENAFAQNNFISEKALIMPVTHLNDSLENPTQQISKVDLSKILFQKQTYSNSTKKSKPHISNDPSAEMEINLHIEELLDSYKGMSNGEIIQVQLKHFQQALDKAINEHYRKLVVIHGVGNGRLKGEVRNILSSYNNLKHHDASYSKYGFGATEILIS